MPEWLLTLLPVVAAVAGAAIAAWMSPNERIVSGVRHFAAGVVFAAAAGEILPDVVHGASPTATIVGGLVGLAVMMGVKQAEELLKGPTGLLAAIGIDVLIDGLVLGVAFNAGARVGLLLAVALTLEILSLGLALTASLGEFIRSRLWIVATVGLLSLLLPLGALLAMPAAILPPVVFTGVLAFGLVALLYLVTEELLVEAHEIKDTPIVTAMFFVGFLAIILLDELL